MQSYALDRFLTTPFDNGYDKWCDKVWELITASKSAPTDDEISDYWDKFFEPLTLRLSVCGTLPSGGCRPQFAADIIVRRWQVVKRRVKNGASMDGAIATVMQTISKK